jgi:hypothetical protein
MAVTSTLRHIVESDILLFTNRTLDGQRFLPQTEIVEEDYPRCCRIGTVHSIQ